jgi:hypothetical protein
MAASPTSGYTYDDEVVEAAVGAVVAVGVARGCVPVLRNFCATRRDSMASEMSEAAAAEMRFSLMSTCNNGVRTVKQR